MALFPERYNQLLIDKNKHTFRNNYTIGTIPSRFKILQPQIRDECGQND